VIALKSGAVMLRIHEGACMNKKQKDKIARILDELNDILSDEEDKLFNMEEKFSETERYAQMEQDKGAVEDAISSLENIEL
jgi:endonuclease IV